MEPNSDRCRAGLAAASEIDVTSTPAGFFDVAIHADLHHIPQPEWRRRAVSRGGCPHASREQVLLVVDAEYVVLVGGRGIEHAPDYIAVVAIRVLANRKHRATSANQSQGNEPIRCRHFNDVQHAMDRPTVGFAHPRRMSRGHRRERIARLP